MLRVNGKIVFTMANTEATTVKGLSKEERLRLLEAEIDLNGRVDRELFEKYGVSIRIHI